MKYSTLMVVPIFLFFFSVGESGYSLPMDVTDDSEHAEKSLETRQYDFPMYFILGAAILAGIGFGFYELGEEIKRCEKQHELEATFTQAVVQNISGEQPQWNVMMYHDDNSIVNFYNYSSNTTELNLHCFGKHQGYTIYVFESGNFTLAGDGGYENWAFYGSFQQNDNEVTFFSMNPTINPG